MRVVRIKQVALMVVAIGFSIASFVTAVKATKTSKEIIQNPQMTRKEKIVRVAGEYVAPVVCAIGGIMAVKDLASIENQKDEAAKFLISEQKEASEFYRKTVAENVRRENDLYISSEAARLMKNTKCPFTADEVDYSKDEMVFYDQLHKEWYKDKRDNVLKAEKAIIKELSLHPVTVNKYFARVNLSPIKSGNIIGWVCEDVEKNNSLFDYSVYKQEDGLIYTVVLYRVAPDIIDV